MSLNFDPDQNHYFFKNKDTVPIVFVHGVGLDHQMWEPQVNQLDDFTILTYDLLGHGKTPLKLNELKFEDFSNQLVSILNNLNLGKINLVGFSLGSLIALDFASKYQEKLNKLILIGTTYKRSKNERS